MRLKRPRLDPQKQAEFIARVKREQAQRQSGYRDQALAILPHLCARCGREFSGSNLRELTVHHKDNNHMNNPADGSNWELLCTACHDDVHQEGDRVDPFGGRAPAVSGEPTLSHNPFAALKGRVEEEGQKDERQ